MQGHTLLLFSSFLGEGLDRPAAACPRGRLRILWTRQPLRDPKLAWARSFCAFRTHMSVFRALRALARLDKVIPVAHEDVWLLLRCPTTHRSIH